MCDLGHLIDGSFTSIQFLQSHLLLELSFPFLHLRVFFISIFVVLFLVRIASSKSLFLFSTLFLVLISIRLFVSFVS